jgi:hypothetical protein
MQAECRTFGILIPHFKELAMDGRFQPGQSGNPSGKKPGTRHLTTRVAESLLGDNAEGLLALAVEKAKTEKSGTMPRALLPLIIAPLKDRSFSEFELPPINSADDLGRALDQIMAQAGDGRITMEEFKILTAWVDSRREAFRLSTLAADIELVKQLKGNNTVPLKRVK